MCVRQYARNCTTRGVWWGAMVAFACLVAVAGGRTAEAALVTTLPSGGSVITFAPFAGLEYNFTVGPVDVGSAEVFESVWYVHTDPTATNSGTGGVLGQGGYGLEGNGAWGSPPEPGNTYTGIDSGSSTAAIRFIFDAPVSDVGGFVNYATGHGDFVVSALALDLTPLESYVINVVAPISTPGGLNAGAFRGISRPTEDIYAFEIRGSYGVLDNLTFSRNGVAAIPEPGAVAIWGLGLGLIGLTAVFRRRRLGKMV